MFTLELVLPRGLAKELLLTDVVKDIVLDLKAKAQVRTIPGQGSQLITSSSSEKCARTNGSSDQSPGLVGMDVFKIIEQFMLHKHVSEIPLKELLGHTPVEVLAGALLGIGIAYWP